MTKADLVYARDAVSASLYCKEWWRMLTKNLKIQKLTADDKVKVFLEIAKGLIIESYQLRDKLAYLDIKEMLHDFIIYLDVFVLEDSEYVKKE